mgnify:CR=1 FL=1
MITGSLSRPRRSSRLQIVGPSADLPDVGAFRQLRAAADQGKHDEGKASRERIGEQFFKQQRGPSLLNFSWWEVTPGNT